MTKGLSDLPTSDRDSASMEIDDVAHEESLNEYDRRLSRGGVPSFWRKMFRATLLPTAITSWSDIAWRDRWRIQVHVENGQHRLLDPRGRIAVAGTEADCRTRLEEVCPVDRDGPHRRYVVVLHGLCRLRTSMAPVCEHLEREAGLTCVNVSYASSVGSIDEHAVRLERLIAELDRPETVHFVAHSMGNLVVRRYLQRTETVERPPLGRFVMLAPPNQGSAMARMLERLWVFRWIYGRGGVDIALMDVHPERLSTPTIPFAIIVGGTGRGGFNPLLPGDDDLIVTNAESDLPGAADRMKVFSVHTVIMRQPAALEATARFLTEGRLREAD